MAAPEERERERRNAMDTKGLVAGPLSALCIIALVMGTASAAVITAADTTSNPHGKPFRHHLSPESIIAALEQQGVDVSEAKTALQNGDTEAVKTWIEAHRPVRSDGSGHAPFDLSNATRQQEVVTRLEAKGVDVSEVKTDLQNGDSAAVQAWLETYFQTHRPAHSPPGLSDPARDQKIIDRLGKQGVDVSEVKTDLQNGDTTAVQTWLETYLHSHEGEMAFHHFPTEPPTESQTGTKE
jgi:hypothetical protein